MTSCHVTNVTNDCLPIVLLRREEVTYAEKSLGISLFKNLELGGRNAARPVPGFSLIQVSIPKQQTVDLGLGR